MPKMTIYPLGNAESMRIDLAGGEKLLFDYANCRNPADKNDRRSDLAAELLDDLKSAGKGLFYEVVCFTHAHEDHVVGMSQFFWLRHAQKYQGEGRVKINELWVPAEVVIGEEYDCEDAAILRAEARHRLREGDGILVFSRPDRLREWMEQNGIDWESRKHLIRDAGTLVPGFTKHEQGVEFFIHSPFAARVAGKLVDLNECAIMLHATFAVGGAETRFWITSDAISDILAQIVSVTEFHERTQYLEWEVFDVPHHCSYKALNKDDKGKDKTTPVPEVARLLEDYGSQHAIIVSSSKPIPADDSDPQPPHRQAARYYRDLMAEDQKDGEWVVTMEHPSKEDPKPVVILIEVSGARVEKRDATGGITIISRTGSRAG